MVGIIQTIPEGLERTVHRSLQPGEEIAWQLKGAFKEALVCTNQRVIIAKSGFMTGQIFGSDIFQLSYASVGSAQVKFHLLTGYFEVSAGGMQNTSKSYWRVNARVDAAKAPNSVSLNTRAQADQFRQAASFIMEQSNRARTGQAPAAVAASSASDLAGSLEKLWAMKGDGALNQEEYEQAKARLLAGQTVTGSAAQATSSAGYRVTLVDAGRRKISAIKVYRDITGSSLASAKHAVEGTPSVVVSGIAEQYAKRIAADFASVGAQAEVAPVA